jgi:ABC-type nitrate/sulfonate/bicarbonate transport system substrate-binding protein
MTRALHPDKRIVPALMAAGGMVAALLAGCGSDNEPQAGETALVPVSFSFGFAPSGFVTNLIATKERGYFEEEGLDVTFVPSNPEDSAKLLASGQVQFTLLHSPDALVIRSQGVPIVSLGTTHQYGTNGILAPIELNVTSPQQLKGRTIGITGRAGNRAMLEEVLRGAGVDPAEVTIVPVGSDTGTALFQKRVDAIGDASTWAAPIVYNAALKRPLDDSSTHTFLRYDAHGVPRYYTCTVVTSEKLLRDDPELARKLLRAWTKGLEWATANPAEASAMLARAYPEYPSDIAAQAWRTLIPLVTSPETEQHGLGWQDAQLWTAMEEFLRQSELLKDKVDIAKAMTNDYLPGKD